MVPFKDSINHLQLLPLGDTEISFKCTPRFPTLDEARKYLDDFWILRSNQQVSLLRKVQHLVWTNS